MKYLILVIISTLIALLDLLAVLLTSVLIVNLIQPESPTSTLSVFDKITRSIDSGSEEVLMLVIVLLLTVRAIGSTASYRILNKSIIRVVDRVTHDLFASIIERREEEVLRQTTPAKLYENLAFGANNLFFGVLASASILISEFATFVGIVVGLLLVSPVITLILGIFLLIVSILINNFFKRQYKRLGTERARSQLMLNSFLTDVVNLSKEIQVDNKEHKVEQIFRIKREDLSRPAARSNWLVILPKYIYEMVGVLGLALLYLITEFFARNNGSVSIASISIVIPAFLRLLPSMLRIQSAVNQMHAGYGGSGDFQAMIDRLMAFKPSEVKRVNLNSLDLPKQVRIRGIKLQDVHYRPYGKQETILRGINLEITQGEKIAILGPSGSGKSTLLQLISGIIVPTEGTIDLITSDSSGFYEVNLMSYVPPNPQLLRGTLIDNIFPFSSPSDTNIIELEKHIQGLDLASVFELFEKHEFEGGENAKLSAGQLQRIGLLRAFVNSPQIMILDEATSALDSNTETKVMQYLFSLFQSKTVIMALHDVHLLSYFDRKIYIENGIVVD